MKLSSTAVTHIFLPVGISGDAVAPNSTSSLHLVSTASEPESTERFVFDFDFTQGDASSINKANPT